MNHCRLVLCVAAMLSCSIAHAGGESKKKPVEKFVVPFELIKTQHIVVKVKINGKGPYRLVFDTGAPDSLVSNKVAQEAEIFPKGFKKPIFALFGSMGQMKIKELELGNLKSENVSTMVLDHPTVQAIASYVGPIEGILGFTFYARYKMSIDYEKNLMTFEPGEYQPGDVIQVLTKKLLAPRSERTAPRILAPAGLLGLRVDEGGKEGEAGVTVKEVLADSPAALAGFKSGDRLLTLDGRWTDTVTDCYIASGQMRNGVATPAEILRDGKKLQLQVTMRAGL